MPCTFYSWLDIHAKANYTSQKNKELTSECFSPKGVIFKVHIRFLQKIKIKTLFTIWGLTRECGIGKNVAGRIKFII